MPARLEELIRREQLARGVAQTHEQFEADVLPVARAEADDGLSVELKLIGLQSLAELGRRECLARCSRRQRLRRLDGGGAAATLALGSLARELGSRKHVRQLPAVRTHDDADADGDR